MKNANFSEDFILYIDHHFLSNYQKKFNNPYYLDYSENPIINLESDEAVFESLAQLLDLKDYYINKSIPLFHFYNSIYDLKYRLERYHKKQGLYGLSNWDIRWLSSLYRGEIFDLGSLRFQISFFSKKEIKRSGDQYMPLEQKWRDRFPEGTPIITIHILKNTDLKADKIDESFDIARSFFHQYFKEHDYEVFVCRTWLLYRPTGDILGQDSNIVSFSHRFKILTDNKNTKQALDRIYGTNDLDLIEKMTKNSSLEKLAYKNLDKLGVATGIIYK